MRKLILKEKYDLVIVGGGIQGCAMLWEAQSRGLNSLLVEAQDYCSQTSANSLKTIHGGIRYLQTMNLARTWRSAKEQETLMRIAPHLIHPLTCLLPTEKKLKRSRSAVTVGFGLYNFIKKISCPDATLPQARCLSRPQLVEHTPLLDLDNVTGAGLWYDAQVQHAERLGLAFVQSAQRAGADAYNYLNADSISKTNNQEFELKLSDQINGEGHEVFTRSVIFCTSSDNAGSVSSLNLADNLHPKFCLAMNLVIDKRYSDMAIGLQSGFAEYNTDSSERLLFSAPWRDATLFGTWYFDCKTDSLAPPRPDREQILFCLNDINKTYPEISLGQTDIGLVHAGLLPLNGKHDLAEKDLMESDLIHQPKEHANLLLVIPTKYTTCRATAEKTIDQLAQSLDKIIGPSVSRKTQLVGGEIKTGFSEFNLNCQKKYGGQFSDEVIDQLSINYGSQIDQVIELCHQNNKLLQPIPGAENHIKAQLEYELINGQVQELSDFVFRRSFLGSCQIPDRDALSYCLERIYNFYSVEFDQQAEIEKLLNNTFYLKADFA